MVAARGWEVGEKGDVGQGVETFSYKMKFWESNVLIIIYNHC